MHMTIHPQHSLALEATTIKGFRRDALSFIDPDAQPLPKAVEVAYVWPTELCSIGCAHCNFASPKAGSANRRKLAERAIDLFQWLANSGCRKLVVCGGGEPLEEPEFILHAVTHCAQNGIDFEIYTSGTSLNKATDIRGLIRQWNAIWKEHGSSIGSPSVRLSVDAFHEEKIGLSVPASWIQAIEQDAPDWTIALRGVRLAGDGSLARLASALNAEMINMHAGLSYLKMPSGRQIKAELKGLVFDGRSSLQALAKRGLTLSTDDAQIVSHLAEAQQGSHRLGRPLSARLTVTTRRIDLEIHSNGTVHVLESQASDTRLNLFDFSWPKMREVYYRDPLLHRVAGWGLPAVAKLIQSAVQCGIAPKSVVPYSVDLLDDQLTLDVVSAMSLLLNKPRFSYSEDAIFLAVEFLKLHSINWDGTGMCV